MKAANIFAVNKDFGNIDTKKKHGEAIAITVEERYRQEMGFSKRDKSRGEIGGVNDYGAWIQNLPYTVLWEVSDDLTESMPGVTLLNTYFIWYDIISRAKEIK